MASRLGDMVHVVVIFFVTVLEIFALEQVEVVVLVIRHMIDTTLQDHVELRGAAVLLLLSLITPLTAVILQISIMLKEQMKIHMSSYKRNCWNGQSGSNGGNGLNGQTEQMTVHTCMYRTCGYTGGGGSCNCHQG